ncbi:MAG TPA: HNH endonuclease [Myxococcales bacterium]|nr:HNH endonuclease [Myxococcales bacterium]
MRAFVGVTDADWYELLAAQAHLDEVNFWQPGGNRVFRVLEPGELFLFKLHSPQNFIVGGGVFAHATILPISLAWDAFGVANGARTLLEMRQRVDKYRRHAGDRSEDYPVGCILLEEPFFLPRERWVTVPEDFARNIVQGKTYDLEREPGATLWRALQEAIASTRTPIVAEAATERYGLPQLVAPRLGQGTFRVLVTDVYQRRCAVTGERTLPVLEAAHIQPYAAGGRHSIRNGLLLRSDLHTLFDRGYLTVTPEARVEVSRRIREEFENGREYYALQGHELRLPPRSESQPASELLRWHNENVFLG